MICMRELSATFDHHSNKYTMWAVQNIWPLAWIAQKILFVETEKWKSELQNFVLEGHPKAHKQIPKPDQFYTLNRLCGRVQSNKKLFSILGLYNCWCLIDIFCFHFVKKVIPNDLLLFPSHLGQVKNNEAKVWQYGHETWKMNQNRMEGS